MPTTSSRTSSAPWLRLPDQKSQIASAGLGLIRAGEPRSVILAGSHPAKKPQCPLGRSNLADRARIRQHISWCHSAIGMPDRGGSTGMPIVAERRANKLKDQAQDVN